MFFRDGSTSGILGTPNRKMEGEVETRKVMQPNESVNNNELTSLDLLLWEDLTMSDKVRLFNQWSLISIMGSIL